MNIRFLFIILGMSMLSAQPLQAAGGIRQQSAAQAAYNILKKNPNRTIEQIQAVLTQLQALETSSREIKKNITNLQEELAARKKATSTPAAVAPPARPAPAPRAAMPRVAPSPAPTRAPAAATPRPVRPTRTPTTAPAATPARTTPAPEAKAPVGKRAAIPTQEEAMKLARQKSLKDAEEKKAEERRTTAEDEKRAPAATPVATPAPAAVPAPIPAAAPPLPATRPPAPPVPTFRPPTAMPSVAIPVPAPTPVPAPAATPPVATPVSAPAAAPVPAPAPPLPTIRPPAPPVPTFRPPSPPAPAVPPAESKLERSQAAQELAEENARVQLKKQLIAAVQQQDSTESVALITRLVDQAKHVLSEQDKKEVVAAIRGERVGIHPYLEGLGFFTTPATVPAPAAAPATPPVVPPVPTPAAAPPLPSTPPPPLPAVPAPATPAPALSAVSTPAISTEQKQASIEQDEEDENEALTAAEQSTAGKSISLSPEQQKEIKQLLEKQKEQAVNLPLALQSLFSVSGSIPETIVIPLLQQEPAAGPLTAPAPAQLVRKNLVKQHTQLQRLKLSLETLQATYPALTSLATPLVNIVKNLGSLLIKLTQSPDEPLTVVYGAQPLLESPESQHLIVIPQEALRTNSEIKQLYQNIQQLRDAILLSPVTITAEQSDALSQIPSTNLARQFIMWAYKLTLVPERHPVSIATESRALLPEPAPSTPSPTPAAAETPPAAPPSPSPKAEEKRAAQHEAEAKEQRKEPKKEVGVPLTVQALFSPGAADSITVAIPVLEQGPALAKLIRDNLGEQQKELQFLASPLITLESEHVVLAPLIAPLARLGNIFGRLLAELARLPDAQLMILAEAQPLLVAPEQKLVAIPQEIIRASGTIYQLDQNLQKIRDRISTTRVNPQQSTVLSRQVPSTDPARQLIMFAYKLSYSPETAPSAPPSFLTQK